MKIVIDIDESILNDAKNGRVRLSEIADAVLSGTPLPKGHGNLIDRDKLLVHKKCKYKDDCWGNEDDCNRCSDNCVEVKDIENAPIIVEAYKGAENEDNNCIFCKFSNNKLSKVEKGLPFTWCRKHRQHVSPNDVCEYFKDKEVEE